MVKKMYVVCSSYYKNHYVDMISYHGDDDFRAGIIDNYMDWYHDLFYLFITSDKKSYGIVERTIIDEDTGDTDDDLPELNDSDDVSSEDDNDTEDESVNDDLTKKYISSKDTNGCKIVNEPRLFLKNQRIKDLIPLMIDSGDLLVEKLCGWGWRQILVFDINRNSPPKKY